MKERIKFNFSITLGEKNNENEKRKIKTGFLGEFLFSGALGLLIIDGSTFFIIYNFFAKNNLEKQQDLLQGILIKLSIAEFLICALGMLLLIKQRNDGFLYNCLYLIIMLLSLFIGCGTLYNLYYS